MGWDWSEACSWKQCGLTQPWGRAGTLIKEGLSSLVFNTGRGGRHRVREEWVTGYGEGEGPRTRTPQHRHRGLLPSQDSQPVVWQMAGSPSPPGMTQDRLHFWEELGNEITLMKQPRRPKGKEQTPQCVLPRGHWGLLQAAVVTSTPTDFRDQLVPGLVKSNSSFCQPNI